MSEAPWGRDWTVAALRLRFGPDTFMRGRAYAVQGRVRDIQIEQAPGTTIITAKVGGGSTYKTTVIQGQGPRGITVHVRCTCPIGHDCKHGVAVIIAAQAQAATRIVPAWERTLREVAAAASAVHQGAPLAVEFTLTGESQLRLRPLVWGKSGKWIKSGITWDALAYDYRSSYLAAHRRALLTLGRALDGDGTLGRYYHGASDVRSLADAGPTVWSALEHAASVGVVFVSANGTPPVRLAASPASLVVEIMEADDGVEIVRRFAVVGAQRGARVTVVGRPAHGLHCLSQGELILAGLQRPASDAEQALLDSPSPLVVPTEDVGAFATGYLPALRRLGRVVVADGLDLPEPALPRFEVRVTPRGQTAALIHCAITYTSGDATTRLSVRHRFDEPPVRDPDAEAALLASLPDGFWVADEQQVTGRELIDFATRVLPALEASDAVDVILDADLPDFREADEAPTVELRIAERPGHNDWFDLGVEVKLGDETVPFAELFTALSRGDDHLILDSGVWFSLDVPELDRLRQLIAEARDLADADEPGSLRLRVEHAGLWDELVGLGIVAEQAASWRKAVDGLLNLDAIPAVEPPTGLNATLRPYQDEGFRWLRFLWASRLGGILADDMGLGKTLQVLTAVASAKEAGELTEPVLVIAPTSVLGTWVAEAATFTPGLSVRSITQTGGKRGATLAEVIGDADIVVTSYTLLRLEASDYAERAWSAVVLDEAQFVKNRQSKAYQAVRKLRAGVRFALTGTPLENNLMDLWSLLSITCPGLFPRPDSFEEFYRRPIERKTDAGALPRLRRRIRPVLLRRTKEAVAAELPPKQTQVLSIDLAPAHRRLYDRQLQAERKKVLGLVGDVTRNRIAILRSLTILRQLSLSPALIDPTHAAASAKIDTLVDLLTEVAAEGHRALVFSQFTSFLALVRKRLDAEGVRYQYLDGRTRDRAARIAAFKEGDDPAFLISLKAGGFGLTLTEADYVFVLDPWWNPAAELQAIDRTHRIGQDKNVMVYRLVSADTIEEKVVALQQRKRDLFDEVLGDDGELAAPLSADDIRGLLGL